MARAMKVPTVFTAVDKFTSVVDKMTSGVSRFRKSTVSSFQRIDNSISKTLNGFGLFQKLAALGLLSLAANANIEYSNSLYSVSAITGVVGKDLALLEQKAFDTAKSQKRLATDVLKTYELIGSAKPELLKNVDALDAVANSAITLSKASGLDLADSATALTDVMNQFNLKAEDSLMTIDALAAGSKYGAVAIPLIRDSILQFGAAANAANVNLYESVGLIEALGEKGLKGAESGTALRNILTKMSAVDALPPNAIKELEKFGVNTKILSNTTLPLIVRLKELRKISGDATAMVRVFALENQTAASLLLNNLTRYEELTEQVTEVGVAHEQAAIKSKSLGEAINNIKTAFLNATIVQNENSNSLSIAVWLADLLSNHMQGLINTIAILAIGYGVLKAVIFANNVVTFAHSVAMGISAARTGAMSLAMKENIVAQTAYKIATGISTAWTWIATTAMSAFAIATNLALWPVLLIIAGIAALIAIFIYWDDIVAWFGKQWDNFVSWISNAWDSWLKYFVMAIFPIVAVFEYWDDITSWFGKQWDNFISWITGLWDKIVSTFTEFDFVYFFKKIGQSIVDFMLTPLKGVLELVSKIPLIGGLAQDALDSINNATDFGVDAKKTVEVLPSSREMNMQMQQSTKMSGNINVNIKDKGGNVQSADVSNNSIPINLTSTQGAF